MAIFGFFFWATIVAIILIKEKIPKDYGKKVDYYYAEPWEQNELRRLFRKQGGVNRLHEFPSIYSDEFLEELRELFSGIDQLKGMEKNIHVKTQFGYPNHEFVTMLRDASVGYLPVLGEMGIGRNSNRFCYLDEETGFIEEMHFTRQTLSQIAKYMSDKYAVYGAPCFLIYDPHGIHDFWWVTDAHPNKADNK